MLLDDFGYLASALAMLKIDDYNAFLSETFNLHKETFSQDPNLKHELGISSIISCLT